MSETQTPHLWDIEHDFYGATQNYWAPPADSAAYHGTSDSWAAFIEGGAFSAAPQGLNVLYRWDWQKWAEDDVDEGEPREVFETFWIIPRKGILASHAVQVTEADEPAVREWLQQHADYMREMWAPLNLGSTES